VRTERNDTTVDTRYFHTDGLGSITAVTNEAGQIVKRFAFDAWGKRLDPSSNGVITSATSGKFTRGFTDHEQLDDLGLVHMNGRIYDPVLGRFLSADPNVDGVSDAQGYNRYSYVGNNPLGATDPSGFFSLKDGLKIVGAIVVGIVTAGVALYAYAAVIGGTFVGGLTAAISSVGLAAGWGRKRGQAAEIDII
jgi:RHS repeat-associated protein